MPQPPLTAVLRSKQLLSERTQTFHLDFEVPALDRLPFTAGQFVSVVAERPHADGSLRHDSRAYSIASAENGNRFELCLNRVEGGYFSNLLADLEPGGEIRFNGPMGDFNLKSPLTDSFLIATGTGIAPMRGFIQQLFPANGSGLSADHNIWLIYGTRHETELYYRDLFSQTAAAHPNFHYLPTLSRPGDDWTGLRGYVQDHVAALLKTLPPPNPSATPETFPSHAYICGLNEMVSANRALLKSNGWHRKQIISERYD